MHQEYIFFYLLSGIIFPWFRAGTPDPGWPTVVRGTWPGTWAVGCHPGDLPGDLPYGASTPRPLGFNLGATITSQCGQQLGVGGYPDSGSCQWEPTLPVGSTCLSLK